MTKAIYLITGLMAAIAGMIGIPASAILWAMGIASWKWIVAMIIIYFTGSVFSLSAKKYL